MLKEKLILAYSGGLDTSVAIAWLKEKYDVMAVCVMSAKEKLWTLFMIKL